MHGNIYVINSGGTRWIVNIYEKYISEVTGISSPVAAHEHISYL